MLILIVNSTANAGLFSYSICSAGCATAVGACYGTAGSMFGTVTVGTGTPAAILGCNASFGKCVKSCNGVSWLF